MQRKKQFAVLSRLVLMVSVMPLIQACATPTTATTIKSQCSSWRAIAYSSKNDTPETVKQARAHNLTGKRLGCWK